MARRGPKYSRIDQEQFEKLCGLQCTKEEIAAFFHVDKQTLGSWCRRTYGQDFKDVFDDKRGIGKVSLRRTQWRLAESHPNMAIFLGKNYLDQHDDPGRYAKGETTEDKLGRMLDALTDAIVVNTPDPKDDIQDDPPDDGDGEDGES